MSKSLLILLVQISKSLVNSKIKILIQKNLSSSLSARLPLPAHSAFGLAGPPGPCPLAGRSPAHLASQPLGPRVPKTFSSLIHAFHSRHLLSIPSLTHGPRLLAPSSPPRRPTPAVSPPRRPLRTSGCRRAITAPTTPPLIPLQTEL
jgi:hypothetical protein